MAKYSGKIGFAITKETSPSVYTEEFTELPYRGDILSNFRNWNQTENVNDNIVPNVRISIIADPFATANWSCIRYAEYFGTFCKVTSAEIVYPRIQLQLGGVYNGKTSSSGPDAS